MITSPIPSILILPSQWLLNISGDMFFVTISTHTIKLLCEGNLDGMASIGSISIEGKHHFGKKTKERVFHINLHTFPHLLQYQIPNSSFCLIYSIGIKQVDCPNRSLPHFFIV